MVGRVALVRKAEEGEERSQRLLDWCEALESVPADASGGMRLFQILRSGGVVGLYSDFLYPDARAVRGFLFGGWVPISRTLLLLIRKAGAVVVPVSITRELPVEGDRVTVRFHAPLSSTLVPGEATEAALAIQLSLVTECLIRLHPAQWRLWNTLKLRWEWGRELA
jgi:lauroyl/myristoyl acyltransferase